MVKMGATFEKSKNFLVVGGTILVLVIILGLVYIVGTVAEKVKAVKECMSSCI
jgi:flagellar biogenesis protein FliO